MVNIVSLLRNYPHDEADIAAQKWLMDYAADEIEKLTEQVKQERSDYATGKDDGIEAACRCFFENWPFIENKDELREAFRKAIAAFTAIASPQWKPIETAPNDGTKFDAGTLSKWGFERITDVWWSERLNAWARWDDTGFERNGEVRLRFDPTHWMRVSTPHRVENPSVSDTQAKSFFKTVSGMKVQLADQHDSPACEVSVRKDTWQLHVNTGAHFVRLDLIEGGLLRDGHGRLWNIFGQPDNEAGRLRDALSFYADEDNWTEPKQANRYELFDTVMGNDLGDRARAVLATVGRPDAS